VEIVIEILSGDDPMPRMLSKCRTYRNWGFQNVYVVEPEGRMVFCWVGDGLQGVDRMASLPVDRIWSALDKEPS
jgi:Uma2 family endonuclease